MIAIMDEESKFAMVCGKIVEIFVFYLIVYAINISVMMLSWNYLIADHFGLKKFTILSSLGVLLIVNTIKTQIIAKHE